MFKDGMSAEQAEITIYTVNYRLVKKLIINANPQNAYSVAVRDLSNGIYYMKAVLLKDKREVFRNVQPIVVLR
jgi:hypothetical protein